MGWRLIVAYQPPNCRCVAVPVRPRARDVIQVDFFPGFQVPTGGTAALAIEALPSATLLALAATLGFAVGEGAEWVARALSNINDYAAHRRIIDAADHLGVDTSSVQGLLAAHVYTLGRVAAENGALTGNAERGEALQVIAEALALAEMSQPGSLSRFSNEPLAFFEAASPIAEQALAAHSQGRVVPQDGILSQGWVEVFPELAEDERRLGDLPGFTPERAEQFVEQYPAEDFDLPSHTGHGPQDDVGDTTVSTPIPDEIGPSVVAMENPHSIESVSMPDDRARHILDGEGRSGGHRFGTGTPGKTEFPADWTDDDILDAIIEVAGTGLVDRLAHREGDLVIVGEVDGVTIEVVVRPNGEVRTGYPLSGPGVTKNPR